MVAIAERPRPTVRNDFRRVEKEAIPEPFLTWDILQEAKLGQLWDIPEQDIEVAKTAIVLDSFSNLSLHEKRRLLAFRLWFLDGSFLRIKTYIGENKGPSLDSLVSSLWDIPGLDNRFEEVQEVMEVMDELTGSSTDILRYIFIFKRFQNQEAKGLEDDEILERKKDIVRDRNREARREYDYLKLKREGKADIEIAKSLGISSPVLKKIEDGLLADGFIAPFIPLQARVALMRASDLSRKQIIKETEEKTGTIRLTISTLIFMGLVQPKPNRQKASEELRMFCLEVERVYLEHPGWDYNQVAAELSTTKPQVQKARMILIGAERIAKITNSRENHRKEVDIRDEESIFLLRRNKPELSHAKIAKRLGVPKWRVGYFISKGVVNGSIARKRPLPKKKTN